MAGASSSSQHHRRIRSITTSLQHQATASPEEEWALVVPDSEEEDDAVSEVTDVVPALLQLPSTHEWVFEDDKAKHEVCELMLPTFCPLAYGNNAHDVNDAATTMFWIGRGLLR